MHDLTRSRFNSHAKLKWSHMAQSAIDQQRPIRNNNFSLKFSQKVCLPLKLNEFSTMCMQESSNWIWMKMRKLRRNKSAMKITRNHTIYDREKTRFVMLLPSRYNKVSNACCWFRVRYALSTITRLLMYEPVVHMNAYTRCKHQAASAKMMIQITRT